MTNYNLAEFKQWTQGKINQRQFIVWERNHAWKTAQEEQSLPNNAWLEKFSQHYQPWHAYFKQWKREVEVREQITNLENTVQNQEVTITTLHEQLTQNQAKVNQLEQVITRLQEQWNQHIEADKTLLQREITLIKEVLNV